VGKDFSTRINRVQKELFMAIRLRIAGIYYDEKFKFTDLTPIPAIVIPFRQAPASGGATIFELMEAALRKPGKDKTNFVYVFERRGKKLSMTSIGVTHKKAINRTLGGNKRAAGTYQLTEIAIPSGVVAWQYYVYRDGVSVSQYQPSGGAGFSPAVPPTSSQFEGFDQFELKDGDEVIWRQVAILRGPNTP
jgi:hypothetical protein